MSANSSGGGGDFPSGKRHQMGFSKKEASKIHEKAMPKPAFKVTICHHVG